MAIVFYGIGYLVKNIESEKIRSYFTKPSLLKVGILLIISIASGALNSVVNMRLTQYGNYFLFLLSATSGVLAYSMLSMLICDIKKVGDSRLFKWFIFIGQNTIIVLIFNYPFIGVFDYIFGHLPQFNPTLTDVIVAILVMVINIPVAYFINRFLPWTLGKSKKSKGVKNNEMA
jgi:fucose 4-O-acetylase-like acetyltransferase